MWWPGCVLLLGLVPKGLTLCWFNSFTCLNFSLWQSRTSLGAESTSWSVFTSWIHSRIYLTVLLGFPVRLRPVARINPQPFPLVSVAWGHLVVGRSKCPFSSKWNNLVSHFTSSLFRHIPTCFSVKPNLTKTWPSMFPWASHPDPPNSLPRKCTPGLQWKQLE